MASALQWLIEAASGLPRVTSVWQPQALNAAINMAFGFPIAYALQSGTFFDVTGSLAFTSVAAYSLLAGPNATVPRNVLATCALGAWAARLGGFLLARNLGARDTRLDSFLESPAKLSYVWLAQTIWVSCGTLPLLAINSSPALRAPLTALDAVTAGLFVLGLGAEVIADEQKRSFMADPANKGKFINTGLWSVVQHPNFAGQMLLNTSLMLFCAPAVLRSPHWSTKLVLFCPLLEILLLTKRTGIPPLHAKADAKWGSNPAYVRYVEETPLLLPLVGRGSRVGEYTSPLVAAKRD
jgi:steroid 5-alpha reductase family enzyme